MPSLSAAVAVLPLIVVRSVGEGIGYIGIPQAERSSSQALGRESRSPWPARGAASDTASDASGVALGTFFPQDGLAEVTEDDWDLEQVLTETASTQQLGTAGSGYVVTSHATSHFAIHDEAENVRDNRHAALGHMDELIQQRQEHHRVPLQNMDNVQYFGDMMIGEPPQRMKVSDNYINAVFNKRGSCSIFVFLALTAQKSN